MHMTEYFEGLGRKEQWDLLGAFRGCDANGSHPLFELAKATITKRIRGIIMEEPYYFELVIRTPVSVTDECVQLGSLGLCNASRVMQDEYSLPSGYAHFFQHLRSALNTSYNHPVWGGLSRELLVFTDAAELATLSRPEPTRLPT